MGEEFCFMLDKIKSFSLLEPVFFFFFWNLIYGKRWLVSYSYLQTVSGKSPLPWLRYKNSASPCCIDLTSMNSPRSFQNYSVVETGLSDFHRIFVNVLKTTFQRLPPKIKNYSDDSNFVNNEPSKAKKCLLKKKIR